MNARAKMSSKGQVVVPKAIRVAEGWSEGTELEWFKDEGGVRVRLSTDSSSGPRYDVGEVAGMIVYSGPPVTDDDMNSAIASEARRRWRDKGC